MSSPIPTVICVLFRGQNVPDASQNTYNWQWVCKLFRGVKRHTTCRFRFICLTDNYYLDQLISPRELGPIETAPLIYQTGDWMCINEIYRPDLDIERGLFLGLDTIITGDITPLLAWDGPMGVCTNPYARADICNAVVSFGRNDADLLWAEWLDDHEKWSHECSTGLGGADLDGYPSELVFLKKQRRLGWVMLDELFPDYIMSYKREWMAASKEQKRQARVVYFHGEPKPPHVDKRLLKHWT